MANFTKVREGVYIVRTQAGFRRAFKDWDGGSSDNLSESLRRMSGYPKSYPSLVMFSYGGRDWDPYPVCTDVHVNVLQGAIVESEQQQRIKLGLPVEKTKEELAAEVHQLRKENQLMHYRMAALELKAKQYKMHYESANKARLKADDFRAETWSGLNASVDKAYSEIKNDPSMLSATFVELKERIVSLFSK
jgi:hypothetical protein